MKFNERHTEKVIIVTGSSRGIGKSVAKKLLERGYSVVINGRNADRLDRTEKELQEVSKKLLAVVSDVSNIDGAQTLVTETLKKFSRVDALINNVGVSSRGNMTDLNPSVVKTVFESNVYGAINPTIYALPELRKSRGSLVFVSSLAGIRGLPGLAPYSASKMALRAFVESIRIEEHANGVHAGLVLVGQTSVEADKEVITVDGGTRTLAPRKGKNIQTMEEVAHAIIQTMHERKYMKVLTSLGKTQAILQAIAPRLVERIILINLDKFEEGNR